MSTKQYLTTRQFSEITGVHIKAVYKNIRQGRLKAYRQSSAKSNYLIDASETSTFVKRKPIEGTYV